MSESRYVTPLQLTHGHWRRYTGSNAHQVITSSCTSIANIVSSNRNKPCVLFNTIDSVVNSPQNVCLEASPEMSNEFLLFLFEKVVTTMALSTSPDSVLANYRPISKLPFV